jgi:hypothetical protein
VSPVRTLPQIVETLAGHGLELVRSWPRSAEHLLLDLRVMNGSDGSSTAGQWFSSSDQARVVAEATQGSTCAGQLVFQPGGADRALRPLRAMVAEPTTELISHRPERRAVLRERSTSGVRYTRSCLARSCLGCTGPPLGLPRSRCERQRLSKWTQSAAR